MGEVTVREAVFDHVTYKDRVYTDDEIRELFEVGGGWIVMPLLERAVAAEAERDRLRELLRRWVEAGIAWYTGAMPGREYWDAQRVVADEARRIAEGG